MFANRHTTKPAEKNDQGEVVRPRVRVSKVRGRSFRRWARAFYEGEHADLSQKLERMVRGEQSKRVA